jgi:TP901 family phage tail tape measure protein
MLRNARGHARAGVEARLDTRADLTGFQRYENKLREVQAKVRLRENYRAHLGADFDPRAFNAMHRELTRTQAAVARVEHNTGSFGTRLKEAGVGALRAGAQMATMGIGFYGAERAIHAAANASINFQQQLEMVHTQAGADQIEVDKLKNKVLDLATAMPQSPEELAKGLFHIESIGLRGAKAMDTLKIAAQGAAVGQADLEDTATALGSAWLVNIKGAGNLHHVMGLLNATVGAGNVRMEELVHALGTGILPASKEAGLSIRDVFGALALFTDEGYQASSAAAQFSTALHFLYNPTFKAQAAMESLGLSSNQLAADMHKKQGLLTALKDLKEHLEHRYPDINLTAGLRAMGISASEFGKRLNEPGGVRRGMFEFNDGLRKVAKTTKEQIPILADMLDNFGVRQVDAAKMLRSPKGMMQAIELMRQALSKGGRDIVQQEQILGAILPGGRGRIMLTLLNQIDRYQQKLGQVERTSKNFGEDVVKTQETAAFRLHAAWSTLQVALVRAGDRIVPLLLNVAEGVSKFVEQMRQGRGAGGEFARFMEDLGGTLKNLYMDFQPIIHLIRDSASWLANHKTLVKDAATAWLIYKGAVVAASRATAAFAGIKGAGMLLAGFGRAGTAGVAAEGAVLAGGGVGRGAAAGAAGAGASGYANEARAIYGTNRALGGGVVGSTAAAAPTFARSAAGALGAGAIALPRILGALLGGPIGIAIAGATAVAIGNAASAQRQHRGAQQSIGRSDSLGQVALANPQQATGLLKAYDQITGRTKATRQEIEKAGKTINRFFGKDLNDIGQKGVGELYKHLDRARGGIERLASTFGKFRHLAPRLEAKDIINPNLAAQAMTTINALARDGASSIGGLRRSIAFSTDAINDSITKGSSSWAQAMSRNMDVGIHAVRRGMHDGTISTSAGMKEIARLTKANMQIVKTSMGNLSEDGRARLASNFRDAADAVKRQMDRGKIATKDGMQLIRKYLAQELQVYGFSLSEARNIAKGNRPDGGPEAGTRGPQGGGVTNPYAPSSGAGLHAGGGYIGTPGQVGHDTVPALLAPGEAVLNRHQQAVVEGLLGDGFLDTLFSKVKTPHFLSRGGRAVRRFASGGIAGAIAAANQLEKAHFPYVWGGGHSGTPAPFGPMDCSGAVSFVLQHGGANIPTMTSGQLARTGKPGAGAVTVYANPEHTLMRIGQRFFGTSTSNPGGGAGWIDPPPSPSYLSRFAVRHFGGAGGDGFDVNIRAPKVTGGGAMGDVVRAALGTSAKAASKAGTRALMSMGLGLGDGNNEISVGSVGKAALKRLWTGAGGPPSAANLAAAIAMAESGGDPKAHNPSGASGLWQILGQVVPGNIYNPRVNASNAVKKWRDAHGFRPWEAFTNGAFRRYLQRGGRIARFAGGGFANTATGTGSIPTSRFGTRRARTVQARNAAVHAAQATTANRGITRSLARKEKGIVGFEDAIQREERRYQQMDREYGISEETLLIENDDGSTTVDTTAVAKRVGELDGLIKKRKQIEKIYRNYQESIQRLMQALQVAIARLQSMLAAAGGKARKKERAGYKAAIATHRARIGELKGTLADLGLDVEDQRIDLEELGNERAGVAGTTGAAAKADSGASGDQTGVGITQDQQALLDQAANLKAIVQRGTFLDTSAAGVLGGTLNPSAPGGVQYDSKLNPNDVGSVAAQNYSSGLVAKAAAMGVNLNAAPGGSVSEAGGGVTVYQTNNMLTASDPNVLLQVGKSAVAGIGYQGLVSSPRTSVGV